MSSRRLPGRCWGTCRCRSAAATRSARPRSGTGRLPDALAPCQRRSNSPIADTPDRAALHQGQPGKDIDQGQAAGRRRPRAGGPFIEAWTRGSTPARTGTVAAPDRAALIEAPSSATKAAQSASPPDEAALHRGDFGTAGAPTLTTSPSRPGGPSSKRSHLPPPRSRTTTVAAHDWWPFAKAWELISGFIFYTNLVTVAVAETPRNEADVRRQVETSRCCH